MFTIYLEEYVFLALLLIIVILLIANHKRKQKLKELTNASEEKIKDIFKERWEKEQQNFKIQIGNLILEQKEVEYDLNRLKTSLEEKEKRYDEVNQDLDKYKEARLVDINTLVEKELEDKKEKANFQFLEEEKDIKKELNSLKKELEDIRSRRAAINEEIKRQRKIIDNEDFYKIQIDKNSLSDISLLRSIAPRLIHPEAVNKLIWSGYYQKPVAELRKRAAIDGSGVYKITRLKTGEVYIGQAVNVSTRWADHVKSALGVGTLASSTLHRLMAEDGPENFSFEIIEKTDKDKLKEKEAFYIDFYDSKNYGMNSISGVKNGIK